MAEFSGQTLADGRLPLGGLLSDKLALTRQKLLSRTARIIDKRAHSAEPHVEFALLVKNDKRITLRAKYRLRIAN
jgi:hypothetical protein